MPPEIRTLPDEPARGPEHKNSVSIPLAIVAAGALIAAAVYFGGSKLPGGASVANTADSSLATDPSKAEPVSSIDHLFGNPNAEIIVVEYSDLGCPFCKIFHDTMHQIVNAYGGKVAWVYRHYPIPQLHPNAPKEAEASECAFEQGGNTTFWNFIDKVFAETDSAPLDITQLGSIANELHLDTNSFNNCLSSGKYTKAIETSVSKVMKMGQRIGTPYSLIFKNGKLVSGDNGTINGAQSFEKVRFQIDSLLN